MAAGKAGGGHVGNLEDFAHWPLPVGRVEVLHGLTFVYSPDPGGYSAEDYRPVGWPGATPGVPAGRHVQVLGTVEGGGGGVVADDVAGVVREGGEATGCGAAVRVRELALAAAPPAAGRARAFVRGVLGEWRLAHLAETAQLLTSELVANAVAAAGAVQVPPVSRASGVRLPELEVNAVGAVAAAQVPPVSRASGVPLVEVRVALAECLYVGVWDGCASPPVAREPDLEAEGGRGLLLVESLSRRWGWFPRLGSVPGVGGKVVWFELDCPRRTTAAGLPVRVPAVVPAPRAGAGVAAAGAAGGDLPVVLGRILERLRRLQ